MNHKLEPQTVIADPEWLAHRYLRPSDEVQFRLVSRDLHRTIPFLTDEYLGTSADIARLRFPSTLAAGFPNPVHFVFHSAFCASTLLTRALDREGMAMGLSEPVILNDIVGLRRRGEIDERGTARLLDGALNMLARPWSPGEPVIVKPSNVVNPLASGLLVLRPDAKAILLFAPLETFLTSVARKGMFCRLWVRELLEGLIREGIADFGFSASDVFRQTDLQCAAIGWLAQHRLFGQLVASYGPSRVRSLSSEALLSAPADVLLAVSRHLDLPLDLELAQAIAEGPVFSRHSKSGNAFNTGDRAIAYEQVRNSHKDEIGMVTAWARAVAGAAGVPFDLGADLME